MKSPSAASRIFCLVAAELRGASNGMMVPFKQSLLNRPENEVGKISFKRLFECYGNGRPHVKPASLGTICANSFASAYSNGHEGFALPDPFKQVRIACAIRCRSRS